MPEAGARAWTRWLALSAALALLDLATKAWMSAHFQHGEVLRVTGFFNLVLAHNPGAAFSFLADAGGWQRWLFTGLTIVISVVLVTMLARTRGNPWLSAALALVLGGALGNLYDRVTLGYVVDFVQLHAGGYYFPAFNVADSAITVGVLVLIADSLRQGGQASAAGAPRQEKP
jgi:signal peptidase II